jgi:hypothetical protein
MSHKLLLQLRLMLQNTATCWFSTGCHNTVIALVQPSQTSNHLIAGSLAQREGGVDTERPAEHQQVAAAP